MHGVASYAEQVKSLSEKGGRTLLTIKELLGLRSHAGFCFTNKNPCPFVQEILSTYHYALEPRLRNLERVPWKYRRGQTKNQ